MNFTHPVHQEMLIALTLNQVDYILVGGYAVIYHGYVRTTGDMDVWLRPTQENKMKLIQVFMQFQFNAEDIDIVSNMDFNDIVIFHIGREPDRIDFLSKIAGLEFEDAFKRVEFLPFREHAIPVLHYDDLISTKLKTGRLKDLADVEHLAKINRKTY